MVHKSSVIPGLSKFIDNNILSQYPPTSIKRILASGAIAIYLNRNSNIVDQIIANPLIAGLGVTDEKGMIDLDTLRIVYKDEVQKAGFVRLHIPIIGDVDFTAQDIDELYKYIVEAGNASTPTLATTASNIIGGLVS
jgi:hypothetical protein